MAINKISGNILADNLQRGANLAVQGNLVYFDITNSRVGVLTDSPGDEFTVNGTANAANVRITSATANGVFYADTNLLAVTDSNLTWDGTQFTVTGNIIANNIFSNGTVTIGNLSVANTTITPTITPGNITLAPTGNSEVIIDTNSGLVLPVGDTAARPGSPLTGTIRWNTSLGIVEVYDGVEWEGVGEDLAVISDQTLTGDGSTLVFALNQNTTANAVIVSTNGTVQRPGAAYTVAGNVITFAEAPQISDIIDVRFIAELSIVTAISNDSGQNKIEVDPSGVANLSTVQSLQLPTYTVTQANALANVATGQVIYVSNGDSGQPCLAVYSVDAWKIVSLGGNITT
jgi:hypothetical protein